MTRKEYSEDLLIQAPTAEFLEQKLGWTSVFAQNEDFEAVLAHEVRLSRRMSGRMDVFGIALTGEAST
jgi:hypothetical protein